MIKFVTIKEIYTMTSITHSLLLSIIEVITMYDYWLSTTFALITFIVESILLIKDIVNISKGLDMSNIFSKTNTIITLL